MLDNYFMAAYRMGWLSGLQASKGATPAKITAWIAATEAHDPAMEVCLLMEANQANTINDLVNTVKADTTSSPGGVTCEGLARMALAADLTNPTGLKNLLAAVMASLNEVDWVGVGEAMQAIKDATGMGGSVA